LFIVLFLTIIAHFLLDILVSASLLPRILIRLAAIPVLAGVSYEAIKLASRNEDSAFFKIAMLPGLALQKITTKPPTLDQIEVAIAAMQAVAPEEHGGTPEAAPAEAAPSGTPPAEADEAPESPVA
jgi:uncharacterized protein YqhQ